jgi:glutamine amidotransferase-like uncharacterized protein
MQKKTGVYFGSKNISGQRVVDGLLRMKAPFSMVTSDDLKNNDLNEYSCLVFPGGHSVQVGKKADQNVKRFVENKGGFLGICAGMHYGIDLKMLDADLVCVRGSGYYQARIIRRHAVTKGYKLVRSTPQQHKIWSPIKYSNEGRVHVRRANGGIIIPGKKTDVLVTYDDTDKLAAIVAGTYGHGRVVLMSPHPESSETPDKKNKEQGQDAFSLFANAVRYVSGEVQK